MRGFRLFLGQCTGYNCRLCFDVGIQIIFGTVYQSKWIIITQYADDKDK